MTQKKALLTARGERQLLRPQKYDSSKKEENGISASHLVHARESNTLFRKTISALSPLQPERRRRRIFREICIVKSEKWCLEALFFANCSLSLSPLRSFHWGVGAPNGPLPPQGPRKVDLKIQFWESNRRNKALTL